MSNGDSIANSSAVLINNGQQLQIQSPTETDTGNYLCIAENKLGIAKKNLIVTVLMESKSFYPEISKTAPKMLENNRVFEVPENETKTLECPIKDTTVKKQWFKNGVQITPTANLQISTNGDKLYIMHGQASDSGRYSCVATNDAGEATANMTVNILAHLSTNLNIIIKLNIYIYIFTFTYLYSYATMTYHYCCCLKCTLVPPKITGPLLRTLETSVGKTVEIECQFSGIPKPDITWTFDGKTLFESEKIKFINDASILWIFDVKSNQEGRYTCQAENKLNRAEADTFLRVNAPPKFAAKPSELKVIQGESGTVICNVTGNPTPTVEWFKNGKPLSSTTLHSAGNSQYIHIVNATTADAGNYTCVATNEAGSDEISTNVQLDFAVLFMIALEITDYFGFLFLIPPQIADTEHFIQIKENSTLTLYCTASGSPVPKISWFREGTLIRAFNQQTLIIEKANASHTGSYTCEAINEAGKTSSSFEVEVFIKPTFGNSEDEISVMENERSRLKCDVKGHPTPTITWLRGGRPIKDTRNFILSPRGDVLMILRTRKSEMGSYSCVAENFAGSAEKNFALTVLIKPYIEETIDQNPRVVLNKSIVLQCPVLGISKPTVEWRHDNELINNTRFSIVNDNDLKIIGALIKSYYISKRDAGRYTCFAKNEAGTLRPPRWLLDGKPEYEVKVNDAVVIDCSFQAAPKPDIVWYYQDQPLYLSENKQISPSGEKLTIRGAQLNDGGKYTCKANNEAGSSEVDIQLKILAPPQIDKSNVIQNPLGKSGRSTDFTTSNLISTDRHNTFLPSVFLECPATGIPQPTVTWYKEGSEINFNDQRLQLNESRQTLIIKNVSIADEGRYYCIAENKGGKDSQQFDLEVLVAPEMELDKVKTIVTKEGKSFVLSCPVKKSTRLRSSAQILWYKENQSIDPGSQPNIKITNDDRNLHVTNPTINDAGNYSCYVFNRAGEKHADFIVQLLQRPANDLHPHVMHLNPITLWCTATGYPYPIIRWYKDGKEESSNNDDGISILDSGQGLEIIKALPEHRGIWKCVAENDAGKAELEFSLDVWTIPEVTITPKNPERSLGDSLSLTCKAVANPPATLTWRKDGQPLISSSDGARISMKGARLDIPHLLQSHIGDYTCEANNDAGPGSATTFVDVFVPPLINRDNVDLSPRLPITFTAMLYCEASGKPFPEIRWYYFMYINDTLITESTEKINIGEEGRYIQVKNISLTDRGIYKCIANNSVGTDEILYTLHVFQVPSILNGRKSKVIEGETANITCDAIGEPPPLIRWLRNSVLLDTLPQKYTVEDKVLSIRNTYTSDSGIYLCTATNEVGEARQAFTLEVLVPPKIPDNARKVKTVQLHHSIKLQCIAEGSPSPKITWTVNGTEIRENNEKYNIGFDGTLTVQATDPNTDSIYKCTASNDAGNDTMEYTVRIRSPPTIPYNLRKVTVNKTEGADISLTCQVSGENIEIKWTKNGSPLMLSKNMSISDNGNTIRFSSVRLGDEGVYSCTASNLLGNATQDIKLFIGTPPKIETPNIKVEAKIGNKAVLECEGIGIPLPKITWIKNNDVIEATEPQDGTKSKLVFENVRTEDSAVYTCVVENWAGSVRKDINLLVYVPPKIYPKQMEISAKAGDDVILTCNATGIPESVVRWIKAANTSVIDDTNKYQFLGTSLLIKNVSDSDEGIYRCTASTSAGSAYGVRNLKIGTPALKYLGGSDSGKEIWVKCDKEGNPIVGSYVPSRGDVPQDQDIMVPTIKHQLQVDDKTKTKLRCLYPLDDDRTMLHPPYIVLGPSDQILQKGIVTELECRAQGNPVPTIHWLKDGKLIENIPSVNGVSKLHINVQGDEDSDLAGNYTCVAENSSGKHATASGILKFEDERESSRLILKRKNKRNVFVFNCMDGNVVQTESVAWKIDGEVVDNVDDSVHVMNNGSLVIYDIDDSTDPLTEEEIDSIECYINNQLQPKQYFKMQVYEGLPEVVIHMRKYYTEVGEDIVVGCHVQSEPLTTKVDWTKNNVPLSNNNPRIRVMPNNSLSIRNLRLSDRGYYKCRGKTRIGKIFDEVELIVQDGPEAVVGFISGKLNNENLTNQPLRMNITPSATNNAIHIKIENLLTKATIKDPVTEAFLGYTSALNPLLAYNSGRQKMSDTFAKFERHTDYKFDSGEQLRIDQKGNGIDGVILKLDILVDGDTPYSDSADMIVFDDFEEEMVEDETGHIEGRGKSTLRINKRTIIPIHWNHTTEYDASRGLAIGPGKKMNLALHVDRQNDRSIYKVDATAKQIKECPKGFHKLQNGYCKDIDECMLNPGICANGTQCINEEGGYKCNGECKPGYKLKLDGNCVDIDECTLGIHNCSVGKECVNLPDIDECATSPCQSPMTCLNQLGTYLCLCPNGLPEDEIDGCSGVISEELDSGSRLMEFDESDNDCPDGYTWNETACKG
uniref:Peroxidasin homolog n=1 Tax=Syphacia muris TaxID=451379 RepID=A0A0N5AL87_9BILA